jgi:hypothetical protein
MKISNIPVGKMLAVLLCAMLSLNLACAVELKKGMSKSAPLTQAYVWYDGDRERQVWLNPQIVAEFNPGPQGESSIKSAYAAAQIMHTKLATERYCGNRHSQPQDHPSARQIFARIARWAEQHRSHARVAGQHHRLSRSAMG